MRRVQALTALHRLAGGGGMEVVRPALDRMQDGRF